PSQPEPDAPGTQPERSATAAVCGAQPDVLSQYSVAEPACGQPCAAGDPRGRAGGALSLCHSRFCQPGAATSAPHYIDSQLCEHAGRTSPAVAEHQRATAGYL